MRVSATIFAFFIFSANIPAQDSIKVHFLYGSKPAKHHKHIEQKWFGGVLGGHVGIETDKDQVLNFVKKGELHWFAKKHNRHSRFAVHSTEGFWKIFGSPSETVKKASVIIPVSRQQKMKLDSIQRAYTRETPYDYAFIGMRCGAATYDILSQLNILPVYSQGKMCRKIFYPKKLRRRLLKKAKENNWPVLRCEGTPKRKWESD